MEDGSVLYMDDDHFAPVHGKGSVALEFSSGKTITLFNVLYVPKLHKNLVYGPMLNNAVVRLSDPKRKTLGKKGIDCIFVGYAEHSKAYRFYVIKPNDSISINSIIESRDKIFDETRFSSIPRPKDIIANSIESQRDDHYDYVTSETPKPRKGKGVQKAKSYGYDIQLYLVEDQEIKLDHNTFTVIVLRRIQEPIMKLCNLKILLSGKKKLMMRLVLLWKIIHRTDQNQVDKTKKILSSRFSMKDMGEADVILGIKIKRENKRIVNFLSSRFSMKDMGEADVILGIKIKRVYEATRRIFMLGNEHKVCKLDKSLYGLKQAPKQWHQKFDEVVLSSGFLLNQSDKFSMKDMGEADVILGIKIKRENKRIVITQSHYIEKILKKFNRKDCSLDSKKQTCITSSTMESEFVALAAAGNEAEWLRNLIHEISGQNQ
nr:zinc finger, CCHC-type [Tanacetum cinerariifolium]